MWCFVSEHDSSSWLQSYEILSYSSLPPRPAYPTLRVIFDLNFQTASVNRNTQQQEIGRDLYTSYGCATCPIYTDPSILECVCTQMTEFAAACSEGYLLDCRNPFSVQTPVTHLFSKYAKILPPKAIHVNDPSMEIGCGLCWIDEVRCAVTYSTHRRTNKLNRN